MWTDKLRKNEKGQADTVLTVIVAGITILLAVVVFAQINSVLPETAVGTNNDTWVFNLSDSGTYTKTLTYSNVVETPDSLSVYNATWTGAKSTDYTVDYTTGSVTNVSGGGMGTSDVNGSTTSNYSVKYGYQDAGAISTMTSVGSIFYSATSLIIIGMIVLAAVFILAAVGRLLED